MEWRSRKQRFFIVLAIVIFLALITAFGLLHIPPIRAMALGYARDFVRSGYGIELEAARLDYNLLRLSVALEDVRVRALDTPDPRPFFEAESVSVNLALLPLIFRRGVTIEEAYVGNASVRYLVDEQGRANLPAAPEDETGDSSEDPFAILVESLLVEGSRILFEDRQLGLTVDLPRWMLAVEGDRITGSHTLTFDLEQAGSVRYGDQTAPLGRLTLRGDFAPTSLEVAEFGIELDDSRLSLQGGVQDFARPVLDFQLEADVATHQLARLADLDQPIQGRIQAQVNIKNVLEEMEISARLNSDDLSYGEFQKVALQAQSAWNRGSQRLTVESLSVRSPEGHLQIQADLATAPDAGSSRVNGRIEDLNLRAVTRQLDLPVQVASRATGTVDASWDGMEFQKPAGKARFEIFGQQERPRKGVLPLSGLLSAQAGDDRLSLSISRLEALGGRYQGELSLDSGERLGGWIEADVESLAELARGLDGFLNETASEPPFGTELDGPATLSATLNGTLERPRVSARLEGQDLAVGRLDGVDVELSGEYDPTRIRIEESRITWREQIVSAQGDVGLEGASPRLELQARVEQGSIAAILAGLQADIPVEGFFEADAAVSGTVADTNLSLKVSATRLKAYEEPFGALTADVRLAGRQIRLEQFRLDKTVDGDEMGHLDANGSYDLDSETFSFQLEGEQIELTRLTLPEETPVRGVLNLSASGSGAVQSPDLDMQLGMEDLKIQERLIGAVNLTARLEDRLLTLKGALPRFAVKATAKATAAAPYPVDFELVTDHSDLSNLGIEVLEGKALSGALTAVIRGSGELERWEEGALEARIRELELIVDERKISNEGELAFSYRNKVLDVEPSTIVMGDSRIRLQGSLPIEAAASPGELTAQGDVNLDTLLEFVPREEPLAANGRLGFDAVLRGSLESIEPSFQAELKRAGFYSPALIMPFTEVEATVRLHEGSLLLENTSADWAGAEITADGELPLELLPFDLPFATPAAAGPARVHIGLKGLVINSFSDLPREAGGTLSLNLRAEAPKLEASALTAEVLFEELKFNYAEFEVEQEAPASLTFRDGEAQIEQFVITGPNTRLEARGKVNLGKPGALDIDASGHTDASILTLFSDALYAAGDSRFELAVRGPLDAPQLSGKLELHKGQFSLQSQAIQIEDLNAGLNFDDGLLTVERFDGVLNGGSLRAEGAVHYAGLELTDIQVDISTENVFLNLPEGLRTLSEADVNLRSREDLIVVGGGARILEGSYTETLAIDRFVLDYLRAEEGVELIEEPSPFLSRIRYDFQVDTEEPIVVDNNLAQLAAEAHLRLVGSYYRPGLTGRITLEEGGELYISENRYLVDQGVIDFQSETRIEPSVNIAARTEAGRYDVTLQVTGGGSEDISTTLTSEPPLPEPDIISVLLTGRTLDEVRGAEVNVVREQALSYITGSVGGRLSRSARETLGLSQVRIEPNLIAAESNPGARLTVGQDITRDLGLIYSMNLADSSDQIWIAQYDITPRFDTRGIMQDDNSYRFEFRHDLRFGGAPGSDRRSRRSEDRKKVGNVEFIAPEFSQQELANAFGLKPGKSFDFFKARRGVNRIENFLAKQDRLESRIRLDRETKEETVDLTLDIDAGPQVEFIFEGAPIPNDIKNRIRQIWREGVFDAQRGEESVRAIRAFFVKDGYLEPDVDYSITTPLESRKVVLFRADPGVQYRGVTLEFAGASAFEAEELRDQLRKADLSTAVYTEPRKVANFVAQLYRQRGYLDVRVQRPSYELDPQTASGRVVVAIDEGALYRIAQVEFRGNNALSDLALRGVLPFVIEQEYRPDLVQNAFVRIEELYWTEGYNDVSVRYELQKASSEGQMNIVFQIVENQQSIVQDVDVQGNSKTSRSFVLSQAGFRAGAPLNFEQINRARRHLYDTGAYSLVEIEDEPLDQPSAGLQSGQKPVRMRIKLREIAPYDLRYGGFLDTERGPGVIVDLTNRNSLGSARVLGFRGRYDADLREVRGYISQPLLRAFPVRTNVVGFLRRELEATFVTDRRGVSLQQEARLGNAFILSYGYRFENTHTFEKEPDPLLPFDVTLNVAPLTATLSRDTRDDFLDASRGSFASQAFEFAPAALGSDLRFIKYFGQFFKYFPLSEPSEIPFGKGFTKSRLVYASGVRVGLAKGLGGQILIPSERFFAGGGTTVRGFEEDMLMPADFQGAFSGGDAVFVTNNELRFPLVSIFDGVGFLDIGNVYPAIGDFNPFEVRKTAGFGLRVRTPYFLLRADYGFKLDRQPGERSGTFFFSIGQAF